MVIDNSQFPPAYINPFMDKLYEWGYAEGLWDNKGDLLQELDAVVPTSESLKSFLIENDIPEWYHKDGWGMDIGATNYSNIIRAWDQDTPQPYGNYFTGHIEGYGGDLKIKMGDIKVVFEQWDNNVPCVGIKWIGSDDNYGDIWWYNPIIFTPTPEKSWFGDAKVRSNFYSLNWKENPFDSIK